MLFNSPTFLFVFLPVVFAAFLLARLFGRSAALSTLILAALVFYGWSEPRFVFVLIGMLFVNYRISLELRRARSPALLAFGIAANLGLLGYFKYANFLVDNVNLLLDGPGIAIEAVVLPIGISFFTFQQVAYLVDSRRGAVIKHDFLQYAAFITFFPHFIAGPILSHRLMLPQLASERLGAPTLDDIRIGLVLFSIGLAKKLLIADHVAIFANPVFDAAESGARVSFLEAWGGVLAYTFQIYFDFSGYSDMAIGLGRMFALRLPINFNSPYKATSIVDFWRRWHMTLSAFLRDYLYVPLGGNRLGRRRRYTNLLTVMLIGGLWHGAGWTFVIWGGIHGVLLAANHLWREAVVRRAEAGAVGRWTGRSATFLAVVIAWVFFRSESFAGAFQILRGMAGLNGMILDAATLHEFGRAGSWALAHGWQLDETRHLIFAGAFQLEWLAVLWAMCWLLPNSQEIVAKLEARPRGDRQPGAAYWRFGWYVAAAVFFLLSVPHLFVKRPFLYFQF